MTLFINRPSTLCTEWVLAGNIPPDKLFSALRAAEFKEKKSGIFTQTFEGTEFTIQRQTSKSHPDGNFHLYYARYNGNSEFGRVINDYVCETFELTTKALEVFIPDTRKSRLKQIREAGFSESSIATSGLTKLFTNQHIALILFDEGYVLQIRGKNLKDWNTLQLSMFSTLDSLYPKQDLQDDQEVI